MIADTDLQRNSNNFDSLRLIAASFVLIGHASPILTNDFWRWDPFYLVSGVHIHTVGVYIFFIISGFLVTHSWHSKKSILDFFTARVLRIFPAVILVVLLSVFVLGILVTTCSMREYFSSELTAKYLQNMTLYRMYYYLPGVFETNPIGASVNGSLWTLPYEFTCYLFLIVLGILMVFKNKQVYFSLFVLLVFSYLFYRPEIDQIVIPVLGIDFKSFFTLLLYFLSGSVFYHFRNTISPGFFTWLLSGIAVVLVKIEFLPAMLYLFILPLVVFQFVFSKRIQWHQAGKYGDFSYGIYLYAFPLQQLVVLLFPQINLLTMIVVSLLITLPFAWMSWNWIEKPALKLRGKFYALVSSSKLK